MLRNTRGKRSRSSRPSREGRTVTVVVAMFLLAVPGSVHPQSGYDYHQFTTELVWRGNQALTLCNGLWVSNRTVEQVYSLELASLLYGNRGGERPYAPMPPDRAGV